MNDQHGMAGSIFASIIRLPIGHVDSDQNDPFMEYVK
jgi:hypothetical protein